MTLLKMFLFTSVLLLSGCAGIYGMTGSDGGTRSGDSVEYQIMHPGLKVTIIEPYSETLIPIETLGKSSPSPLTHTVKFGTPDNLHMLKIIGKYQKDLYLDDKYYGSLWSGDVLINNGIVFIDGAVASQK